MSYLRKQPSGFVSSHDRKKDKRDYLTNFLLLGGGVYWMYNRFHNVDYYDTIDRFIGIGKYNQSAVPLQLASSMNINVVGTTPGQIMGGLISSSYDMSVPRAQENYVMGTGNRISNYCFSICRIYTIISTFKT